MSDPNQGFQPPPPPPAPPPETPRPVKLLSVGIGIFVIGLIVVVLGWKSTFLPGGIGTGIAFAFWGLVLFAFSFIPLPQPKDAEPPMSSVQKVTGIFYEPSRVFKNLRSHPHWLAAFLVVVVANAVYSNAFVHRLSPERIAEYTNDKMDQLPALLKPPPAKMAEVKENNFQQLKRPVLRIQTTAKSFVGAFVFVSIAAALYLLGVMAFGGRINFWQAFAGLCYAYVPVTVINKVVSLIILFIKDPADVHPVINQETLLQDNLGILFKPAEHPALFALGVSIGVLSFYGLWLKAKALTNAGTKVSSSAAWGVAITFWVLGVLLGMIFASLFSGFMS